eukprot:6761672-Pyramimonas_sp.AAC.1
MVRTLVLTERTEGGLLSLATTAFTGPPDSWHLDFAGSSGLAFAGQGRGARRERKEDGEEDRIVVFRRRATLNLNFRK